MDWSEDEKKPAPGPAIGENLETLSVAELDARLAMLEAEMKRVAQERDRKRTHEQAAAKLFKS